MLTSLIIAYFLLHGGAASGFAHPLDRASTAVKKDVTVEATRDQALAIIDTATKANKAFLDQQKTAAAGIEKVLGNRGATEARIDSVMRPFFASDSAVTDRMADATFRLRHVLTAAEWAKVFPPPAR